MEFCKECGVELSLEGYCFGCKSANPELTASMNTKIYNIRQTLLNMYDASVRTEAEQIELMQQLQKIQLILEEIVE